MVLSKKNGDVLGLIGLKHMKTMFFLFSFIQFYLHYKLFPVNAVFDEKNAKDRMISFDLLSSIDRIEYSQ